VNPTNQAYFIPTVNSHINKAGTYGVLESKRTSSGFKSGVHMQFTFSELIDAVMETFEQDELFREVSLSTARNIARQSVRK